MLLVFAFRGTLGGGWFVPTLMLLAGLAAAWDLQRTTVDPESTHVEAVPKALQRHWIVKSIIIIAAVVTVLAAAALLVDDAQLAGGLVLIACVVSAIQATHISLTTLYIAPGCDTAGSLEEAAALRLDETAHERLHV